MKELYNYVVLHRLVNANYVLEFTFRRGECTKFIFEIYSLN